jgi:hypothetical protein
MGISTLRDACVQIRDVMCMSIWFKVEELGLVGFHAKEWGKFCCNCEFLG